MIHTANLLVYEEVLVCQKLFRWDKALECTWSFGMCEITSNLTRYCWTTGVCEYSQTKRKQSNNCPVDEKKKHCISKTIYPPPGVDFKVSIVATLGSTGLKKKGQMNGNPKLGKWWSYKSPEIVIKVYCSTRKCVNILYDGHFPFPSSPFRVTKLNFCEYSQKNQKASKEGSLKTFIYPKPTTRICMRISRERQNPRWPISTKG